MVCQLNGLITCVACRVNGGDDDSDLPFTVALCMSRAPLARTRPRSSSGHSALIEPNVSGGQSGKRSVLCDTPRCVKGRSVGAGLITVSMCPS